MSKADSVKARLRNLAEKEKKPFDYLLTHYFIERLLYRLSISQYANSFILKGGLLLYTIFEQDARATKDIDFLARSVGNSPEELKRIFTEICMIEVDDAVVYDRSSITVMRTREDADYEGVRIKVTGYLDKSRNVLQFDIGFGDVIVPKPITMEYPSLLNMERPVLMAYSNESVIAEKFEAMIYLAEANSRMKDFYDVYALASAFDFEGRVLYEAVRQVFERRGTPLAKEPSVFSPEFAAMKAKQTQWHAFSKRIGADTPMRFADVIVCLRAFLQPVYECILSEKEFFGWWKKGEQRWR